MKIHQLTAKVGEPTTHRWRTPPFYNKGKNLVYTLPTKKGKASVPDLALKPLMMITIAIINHCLFNYKVRIL